MNLHNLAANMVASVNPFMPLSIKISTGYATDASGKRTPTYDGPIERMGQVQPLQYNDIAKLDGENIQGVRKKIYINGRIDGLVRASGKGGDIIETPDGRVWNVAYVLEEWPDWCCVAVTQQTGGA